ncbi:MAG: hypothetical protein ABEK50_18855 [bacterium]
MSGLAERSINLTAIPMGDYESTLSRIFEDLSSGESMRIIDDFVPEWICSFFEEQYGITRVELRIDKEPGDGRYVLYVTKISSEPDEFRENGLDSLLSTNSAPAL